MRLSAGDEHLKSLRPGNLIQLPFVRPYADFKFYTTIYVGADKHVCNKKRNDGF